MKKVSVIVPLFKVEDIVKITLESIVNQTYENKEIIVVNDGSPDRSAEVAQSFLEGTNSMWKLINIPNGGVSNARNVGIKEATGDYIACVDSDDFIQPNYLERMVGVIEKTGADFSFCQYRLVSLENIRSEITFDEGEHEYSKEELKQIFLHRSLKMIVAGMVIKKHLFDEISFDKDCPYSEDTLFTWELIFHSKSAVCVNSDLYNYYVHEGSKQHSLTVKASAASIAAYSRMAERLLSAYADEKKFIDVIVPKFILSAHHVLSRCVPWPEFRRAYCDTSKKGMLSLYKYSDFRLLCYLMTYLVLPRLFYKISQ